MENDEKVMSAKENLIYENNIFIPDYFGQKVKNAKSFKNWQNSMLKIYGNNAVLIYCPEDDLYFYSSNKEYYNFPYCSFQCPNCKYNICYYCSLRIDKNNHDYGRCCVKRRVYFSFHEYNENEDVFLYLVPFINSLCIILRISQFLFYTLRYKDTGYYDNLEKNSFIIILITFLNAGYAILLSIIYFFFELYFFLIVLIISIPFKSSPIKNLAGILGNASVG